MANSVRLKINGLSDLDKAMDNLSKSVSRNVMRTALKKAAQPMADKAKELVPVKTGTLRDSIKVGSLLNKNQKKLQRKLTADERSSIELFVGPSYLRGDGGRHGHLVEFGTAPHMNGGEFKGTQHPGTAPHPFMRPAFDAEAKPTIERLKPLLWAGIERAARRIAKKRGWET